MKLSGMPVINLPASERLTELRQRVVHTGRELLERSRKWRRFSANAPCDCDVVVTFKRGTTEEQITWISDRLQARIPELIFISTFHKSTQRSALHLTCSYEDFLKGAQEVRMRKRLTSECGGELREFCIEDCENFDGVFNQETFFTSGERQAIVRYYMMNLRAVPGDAWDANIKFSHGQAIISVLLTAREIDAIFPLHDREALATLQNSWVRGYSHRQPLDSVAQYFGVQIALYFAWLGHYTTALLIPAVVGLLCWLLTPAGKETVLHYPLLAFFTILWAAFFQESWRRTSNHYTHHWGTMDKLPSLLEEPRPLFRGVLEPSPITGRLEPFYPRWMRNLIVWFVTVPITLACLAFVIVVAIGHVKLQEYADDKSSSWRIPGAKFVPYLPVILYGLNIAVLNAIYRRIAIRLTDLENHRLAQSYNQALVAKLILFQFINAFFAPFYIVFYRMDLDLLRQHLVTILVTRQIANNLMEVFLPLGETRIRQVYLSLSTDGFPAFNKDSSIATEDGEEKLDQKKTPEVIITRAEQEEIMPKYDDTTNDYLEMFIQFGFVSMFTCAFPICGLLAFLNNILEIRSDAYKLIVNFQRPFSEEVHGIGVWEKALEIVSYVAITVNIGIIGISGSFQALFPGLTNHQHIILLIAMEHILFVLRFGLSYTVPPIPLSLERSLAILEHKRREALRTVEREVRKEARRVGDEADSSNQSSYQNSDIDSS